MPMIASARALCGKSPRPFKAIRPGMRCLGMWFSSMGRAVRFTVEKNSDLNADDCFRPGALRKVAAAFQSNPAWDALFGDVVFVDGEGREIYRREEARYDYKILLYGVDYICHQALFVRKAVYDRLGGYRHKEFLNSADYEFKLR